MKQLCQLLDYSVTDWLIADIKSVIESYEQQNIQMFPDIFPDSNDFNSVSQAYDMIYDTQE